MYTRYLLNDHCAKENIPWIYGGAVGLQGMVGAFIPPGPCLRCLFREMPPTGVLPTCESMGVLNTVPAVIGALEATMTIQMLVGQKPRRMIFYVDPWNMEFQEIPMSKDTGCPCCGKKNYEFLKMVERPVTTSFCEGDKIQVLPTKRGEGVAALMAERYDVPLMGDMAAISVEGVEIVVFNDGRAIITGTGSEKEAQSLYARYVGW